MVAVLCVLTITILILVDWILQLVWGWRARRLSLTPASHFRGREMSESLDPPGGLFFHPAHSWALVEPSGCIRVGLDGLVGFLLGHVDRVQLPAPGQKVREGEGIARLLQGDRELQLTAPVDGTVVQVNQELLQDGVPIESEPYGAGWICVIQPESLSKDLLKLMIADQASEWHAQESERMLSFLSHGDSGIGPQAVRSRRPSLCGFLQGAGDDEWGEFQKQFLDAK